MLPVRFSVKSLKEFTGNRPPCQFPTTMKEDFTDLLTGGGVVTVYFFAFENDVWLVAD